MLYGTIKGVTKRCRLSLLTTNSALVVRVHKCGGREGVARSQPIEYSCAHHVTWSPNKLWRSTSIFNLCCTISVPDGSAEDVPGRLLLEQAHHVATPIQEVEYATLELETDWLLIRIRICPCGSGSGIIIPDPDPGRLLLEQAHRVATPSQEVEYATLALEAVLWIRNFLP
jgi:hypothetical protein